MEAFDFKQLPMKNVILCINNKPTLVRVMAWHLTSDSPLSEPTMAQFIDKYMRHSATMCWIIILIYTCNLDIYMFNLDFGNVLRGVRNRIYVEDKRVYLQIGINQTI